MTLPLSAADVLAGHVVFEIDCIDRMYCNAYVRRLTYPGGVASFFTHHRGATFASTVLADPISKAFVAAIYRYAAEGDIPIVRFEKGQRKDDVAHEYLGRFTGAEGIYLIGVAQEKTNTFRTEKRRNPATGARYPWIVSATALVNQYYLYGIDAEFGPFFVKFSSYFPYGCRLCLLTELRVEFRHLTGQIPLRVATVPGRERIRRAVPGPHRVGGVSARGVAGERGPVRALPAA